VIVGHKLMNSKTVCLMAISKSLLNFTNRMFTPLPLKPLTDKGANNYLIHFIVW